MQDEVIARNWRELIRPRRLEVEEDSLTSTYGRFHCEPLERGFGTTLGNALRRVLLSSLQGAAITNIRIDGVLHEFSTIPGVMEDVATVVLNLKDVRVRMNSEGPKTIRVKKSGQGIIVAGDLVSPDQTVEIMNPDHKICTLGPDSSFEMEVTVGLGKGYVLADQNKA
jgi:DNA-directed RNA polymerase subunit alpha